MSAARTFAGRAAAAAALASIAACGPAAPADAAIGIDGEVVTVADVEALAAYYREWLPALGEDTGRAAALERGLLPRALVRREFPQGVAEARKKAAIARQRLGQGVPFEQVRAELSDAPSPALPAPAYRAEIEPFVGAAVFGKPAGHVTPALETTYAVVIARVDLPLNPGVPDQEGVVLSTIEALYDRSLADAAYRTAKFHDDLAKAKLVELRPGAFRWLPARLRARQP